LALGDVVADELNAQMNKLTEQLRQQAQEEVLEVGNVGGVKNLLVWVCELAGARAGVKRYGGSVEEIPHINDEPLELFDVQSLHAEVGLAQEEELVVGGEGC
jgi:hypothetical protein